MAFDGSGPGVDRMGSIFSAMALAAETWSRTGNDVAGFNYHGTVYGMPNHDFRGSRFGSEPRFHAFQLSRHRDSPRSCPTNKTRSNCGSDPTMAVPIRCNTSMT
jgi:hypothetical protein